MQLRISVAMLVAVLVSAAASFGAVQLGARAVLAYNNEGAVLCKHSFSGTGLLYLYYKYDPTYPPQGIYYVYHENGRGDWNGSLTAA
jgi:hypothetical protein